MEIFLTWNPRIPNVNKSVEGIERVIKNGGHRLAGKGDVNKFKRFDRGLVVSLGGDGTFLRCAQKAIGTDALILPIRSGTVGYLADYDVASAGEAIQRVCKGEHRVMKAPAYRFGKNHFINDLSVIATRGTGVVSIKLRVEGLGDYTVRGDGVVVSSKLGSTAYNLSAGGPISLEEGLIVTPVSPFNFCAPLFIGKRSVELKIDGKNETSLVYDGIVGEGTDVVKIEPTDKCVKFVWFLSPAERIKRLWNTKSQL